MLSRQFWLNILKGLESSGTYGIENKSSVTAYQNTA